MRFVKVTNGVGASKTQLSIHIIHTDSRLTCSLAQGWDSLLLGMISDCRDESDRPVITTYPPDYHLDQPLPNIM